VSPLDVPRRLLERLGAADSVVVFTGAGMSAESGVPTFRGAEGIWSRFKPEELATMSAFLRNPQLVWEWYAHRRRIIATVQPNAGHRAVADLEHLVPRVAVITQNIDNLHRRAGSTVVHELHGNIERNYCVKCGAPHEMGSGNASPAVPRCAMCGGLVRPDVVWFGEMLPEEDWEAAVRAASGADVCISVGTSGVVYPAASIPAIARKAGALHADVNPEPGPLSEAADVFIKGLAGAVLPDLVQHLEKLRSRPDIAVPGEGR
jgi:NAD-dependent deacetylase